MGIEYVTKGICFDNLLVEVSVVRYTCDDCARRETFHDVPQPYNEVVPTPQEKGWRIITPIDDGPEGARCAKCVKDKMDREAIRASGRIDPPNTPHSTSDKIPGARSRKPARS